MAPKPVDLEPHREWIVAHLDAGYTVPYICAHLPLEGSSVSEKTLRRRLDSWGVRHPDLGSSRRRRRNRRERELEAHKAWIVEAYERWDPVKAIIAEIERRVGIAIGERRLHTLLHEEWDIPERRADLEAPEVRALITVLVRSATPVRQIKQSLQDTLGIRKTSAWIYQRLKDWDIPPPKNRLRHRDEDELSAIKDFIQLTFFEARQTDADLKDHLDAMGYKVSLDDIFRLRKEMGLLRKHTQQQADDHLERLRVSMSSCQHSDILVPRLTKKMLPVFFRQEFNISVSRAMAWRFLQLRYPEQMLNRVREVARRRCGFLCPGPNYIWSIDAYCKLAHWGIEVYACIDAYSRYIIWGHVGHTAQTQRSVALQYLDTIRTLNYLPLIIRSDHGVETGMIAGAHYWLSAGSTEGRLLKPSRDEDGNVVWIYRENANGMEVRHVIRPNEEDNVPPPTFSPLRQLEFKECYSYGLSTKNQRIESWWSQLNFHVTGYWRHVFGRMTHEQDWDPHRIADRIALLFLFLPQIHWEIGRFIRMWNGHRVRAQRNRPHVVPGIPRHNYFGRDSATRVNCSVPVNHDHLARLEEALEHDRRNVTGYLSEEMMGLCETMMGTLDMDAMPPGDPVRPLLREYRHLRRCLQHHEDHQLEPLLHLAEKPTGGWPALEEVVQETGRSLEDILGESIYDDFDPGLDE